MGRFALVVVQTVGTAVVELLHREQARDGRQAAMYSLVDPVGNGETPPSKACADCMLALPSTAATARTARYPSRRAGTVSLHFCLLVSYPAWLVVSPSRRLVGARLNNGALRHRLAAPTFSWCFCEDVQRMCEG
jgi:hypothetical protein